MDKLFINYSGNIESFKRLGLEETYKKRIVFIEKDGAIYTHNAYYAGPNVIKSIQEALNELQLEVMEGDYVSSIKQVNGKIEATMGTFEERDSKILRDSKSYTDTFKESLTRAIALEYVRATEVEKNLSERINNHLTIAEAELSSKADKDSVYDKDQIDLKLTGVYKIKGSCTFENLPETNKVGDVYNITNSFTLDGEEYTAGTNIVYTENGWDTLAGIFDTSELESEILRLSDSLALESVRAIKAEIDLEDKFNNYLPLSGGTITGYGNLNIKRENEGGSYIKYSNVDEILGHLGVSPDKEPVFIKNETGYKIYHEGNFNPSNYLPLTGGTITGTSGDILSINRTSGYPLIQFKLNDDIFGYIGINTNKQPIFVTHDSVYNKIWHEGNDGGGSGLDADMLDGLLGDRYLHPVAYISNQDFGVPYGVNDSGGGYNNYIFCISSDNTQTNQPVEYGVMMSINNGAPGMEFATNGPLGYSTELKFRKRWLKNLSSWKTVAFTDSDITGNAATATTSKYLKTSVPKGQVDANNLSNNAGLVTYHSYIGNDSHHLPIFNGYLNGILSLGLHENSATAQFYMSKDNPLYYRSNVNNDWKQIAFTNDYYKDMRVGLADDLGDIEEKIEEEYTIQPTANTNEIRDGYAHIDSLKGNSIVWNLLFDGVIRSSGTSLNVLQDGKYICTPTGTSGTPGSSSWSSGWSYLIRGVFPGKYLVHLTCTRSSKRTDIEDFTPADAKITCTYTNSEYYFPINMGETKLVTAIILAIDSGLNENNMSISLNDCIVEISNVFVINITKMFGEGNEPETVEEFYARIPQGVDLYAYNEGEIINLTADSIKSVGFNQWDEEWEVGDIKFADGADYDSSLWIRNKSYVPVVPNNYYFIRKSDAIKTNAYLYDKHKNYIKYIELVANRTIFVELAKFIRFASYESTYNNDICINISNPDKNGTYEPYKEFVRQLPTNLFEGGMKSAGTAYDEIYWDKNKKKYIKVTRIGSVDLGSLNWERTVKTQALSEYKFTSTINISNINGVTSSLRIICSNYLKGSVNEEGIDKVLEIGKSINIVDNRYTDANTFKQAMQGVILNYELAEPIIEELDIPYMDYEVSNDGTERIESSTPSTPIKASVTYNFDAINTIKLNRFDVSDIKKGATKLAKPVKLWGNDFDGSSDIGGLIKIWNNLPLSWNNSSGIQTECLKLDNNNNLIIGGNVSGNVGIGTKNPLYKLDVNGSIHTTDSITLDNAKAIIGKSTAGTSCNLLSLNDSDTLNIGYGVAGNGCHTTLDGYYIYLRYGASHTPGMLLTSTGNVGIGINDPQAKLLVAGTIKSILSSEGSDNVINVANATTDLEMRVTADGNRGLVSWNNGVPMWLMKSANDYSYTSFNVGNIGIGTTNPKNKLDVNGSIRSSNGLYLSNNNSIFMQDTSKNDLSTMHMNTLNNLIIGQDIASSGFSTFIDGSAVHLRYSINHLSGLILNESGNVTIGNSNLAQTNHKLYVDGSSRFNGAIIINNEEYLYAKTTNSGDLGLIKLSNSNNLFIGEQVGNKGNNTYICGNYIYFRYGTATSSGSQENAMVINPSGNITIGNSDLALTNYKLYVDGLLHTNSLSIQSDTKVDNLNADKLDGYEAEDFALKSDIEIEFSTYSELVTLRNNSQLVPGKQYRITDYITTTTQAETQSAGHLFDVIVTADTVNILNETARITNHEGDTYFANENLAAFLIKYCLDNDTTRFSWADTANGKGVIYYMKDQHNNETPYDFKNIQFKRYKVLLNNEYCVDYKSYIENDYVGFKPMNSSGASMHPDLSIADESDFKWYYTFSRLTDETDASINSEGKVHDNVILPVVEDDDNLETYALNNIVLITNKIICENKFNDCCFLMTFIGNEDICCNYIGSYSRGNILKNCLQNYIGNNFQRNIIISDFTQSNTIGLYFTENIALSQKIARNDFGNGCNNNIFIAIKEITINKFFAECKNNIIVTTGLLNRNHAKAQFSNNVINCSNFIVNTIENGFKSNIITEGNFAQNTIGHNCTNNIFNTFMNSVVNFGFKNNTFKISSDINSEDRVRVNDCYFGSIILYNNFYSTEPNTSDYRIQNLKVQSMLQGTESAINHIKVPCNATNEVNVVKKDNGDIVVFSMSLLLLALNI